MAGATFKDTDKGWNRVKEQIAKTKGKPKVVVGVFGAAATADHGGVTNISVATTHELGATLRHPGGTAYMVDENGQARFVSNAAAEGLNLPRTKPHDIEIPKRSFIADTVDIQSRRITKLAKNLMGQVLDGKMEVNQALEFLGIFVQGEIRKRMSKGIPPPLKASTVKRKTINGKKGTTPLIDTGQLRSSIDYQVRKR